ncbi:hypothetical protein F5Y17DRAFT_216752 [Xylariaceae sp. FL0594]|nr:hypothetical protein F5Y17DRAFT_216752 [Xylariaceae sp. FL0594]
MSTCVMQASRARETATNRTTRQKGRQTQSYVYMLVVGPSRTAAPFSKRYQSLLLVSLLAISAQYHCRHLCRSTRSLRPFCLFVFLLVPLIYRPLVLFSFSFFLLLISYAPFWQPPQPAGCRLAVLNKSPACPVCDITHSFRPTSSRPRTDEPPDRPTARSLSTTSIRPKFPPLSVRLVV